jgi:hypothetical protein
VTDEIYKKSIETGELQLVGFSDTLSHFGIVFFCLFMPLTMFSLHLIDFFQGRRTSFREGEFWIILAPSIVALLFYWIQKRRLKFRIAQTNLKRDQLLKIINEVAKELKWKKVSSNTKVYKATTDPGFFSGSWGEQITILFYEDNVFVNSICDLDKRSSVVSWGRNKENEKTLIDRINEANYKLGSTSYLSEI